jgi:hypothetical protein
VIDVMDAEEERILSLPSGTERGDTKNGVGHEGRIPEQDGWL